jgi:hypothetical protein
VLTVPVTLGVTAPARLLAAPVAVELASARRLAALWPTPPTRLSALELVVPARLAAVVAAPPADPANWPAVIPEPPAAPVTDPARPEADAPLVTVPARLPAPLRPLETPREPEPRPDTELVTLCVAERPLVAEPAPDRLPVTPWPTAPLTAPVRFPVALPPRPRA